MSVAGIMRIAFEASSAISKKPTGIANYITNFIKSFADLNSGNSLKILYKFSRLKYKKDWFRPDSVKTQVYHNSLFPFFKKTDILHGLDGFVPNWKNCKKVVTLYDIFPLLNKDDFISPESFRNNKEIVYREAISRSDLIITISENTKDDLVDYFQVPESKIVSVYPGIDLKFFGRKDEKTQVRKLFNLNRDYLLFVGTVSGRKNTARLVEAFAKSRAKDEFDLVLGGSLTYMSEHTLKAIEKNNISDKVKILGYVADEYKPALYCGAKGFLFPTLYEGFGFPILEAMLCNVPVLTSNVGSAPEIGREFALYVDPNCVESIANGIDLLVEKSDFDLISAEKYASGFTWKKCAERMLKIYSEINNTQ